MTAKDLRRKRRDETHAQWQMRLAAMTDFERETGEPILTPEATRHGTFDDVFMPAPLTGQLAKTKRRRSSSAFARMHENGSLTAEQYAAALEIARVAEMIERNVGVRGASLEARVDNAGSGHDLHAERLYLVRLERTYSIWRTRLSRPRRMVIDMVLTDQGFAATARMHYMGWARARVKLINALDRWIDIREKVWREVDQEDLDRARRRIEIAA